MSGNCEKGKRKVETAPELEEWFDVVDPSGEVTGRARRSACHGNPDLLHQAVHVFVLNGEGEVFLQKRSWEKDIQPGKWDTSVGGHVEAGEGAAAAAVRELREELGVEGREPVFLYRYLWRSEVESELIRTYVLRCDGPFRLHPEEIDDGRFWPMGEVDEAVGRGVLTPNLEHEWRRFREAMG